LHLLEFLDLTFFLAFLFQLGYLLALVQGFLLFFPDALLVPVDLLAYLVI